MVCNPVGKNLIFFKDGQTVIKLLGIGMSMVNLTFLAIAWFSLEREGGLKWNLKIQKESFSR